MCILPYSPKKVESEDLFLVVKWCKISLFEIDLIGGLFMNYKGPIALIVMDGIGLTDREEGNAVKLA